jgi:hypothetical protein
MNFANSELMSPTACSRCDPGSTKVPVTSGCARRIAAVSDGARADFCLAPGIGHSSIDCHAVSRSLSGPALILVKPGQAVGLHTAPDTCAAVRPSRLESNTDVGHGLVSADLRRYGDRRCGNATTIRTTSKRALPDGASGVFEHRGKKAREIDEERVKERRAWSRKWPTVLVTKARTADRQVRRKMIAPADTLPPICKQAGSEAKAGVRKRTQFYDRKRPHAALGGKPTNMVHRLRKDETRPDQQAKRGA